MPTSTPRSPEARAAFTAFLATKGPLRRSEAVLCALYWLGDEAGAAPVHSTAVAALYPKHLGRRLTAPADLLRHPVRGGLVEARGDGWYRITPLGRLVVEALPDRAEIGRLRGMRVAAPAPRRLVGDAHPA